MQHSGASSLLLRLSVGNVTKGGAARSVPTCPLSVHQVRYMPTVKSVSPALNNLMANYLRPFDLYNSIQVCFNLVTFVFLSAKDYRSRYLDSDKVKQCLELMRQK